MRHHIRHLSLLLFTLPLLATSPTSELRRETQSAFGTCDSGQFTEGFPVATAYVNALFQHIARNNPEVFRGDLAPDEFCVGIKYHPIAGRAWAQADRRTIVFDTDMLMRVQNDAQLAGIVGHEMAHVSMRHFVEDQAEHEAGQPNYYHEAEADKIGAHLYLKAGFTSDELAWRHQQLATMLAAAGNRMGYPPAEGQRRPDVHAHVPPISASERIANGYRACGVTDTANMTEPDVGILRYPSECWTIWSLRHGEPARSAEYRRLMNDSRSIVNLSSGPTLAEVKAEIEAYVPPPDPKLASEGTAEVTTPPPPKNSSAEFIESVEQDIDADDE